MALNNAALLICLPIIILLFAFERSSACNLFFRLHFLAGLGIIHTAAFIFIVDSSLLPTPRPSDGPPLVLQTPRRGTGAPFGGRGEGAGRGC